MCIGGQGKRPARMHLARTNVFLFVPHYTRKENTMQVREPGPKEAKDPCNKLSSFLQKKTGTKALHYYEFWRAFDFPFQSNFTRKYGNPISLKKRGKSTTKVRKNVRKKSGRLTKGKSSETAFTGGNKVAIMRLMMTKIAFCKLCLGQFVEVDPAFAYIFF